MTPTKDQLVLCSASPWNVFTTELRGEKAEGCLSLCFQRGDPEALGSVVLLCQAGRVILYAVLFPGTQ